MRVLFSSTGNSWKSTLDGRFGRAKGFILYDEEKDTFSWHTNEDNRNTAHGAGTQAAQFAINSGASVLITGHIGPKAFDILKLSDIGVFNSSEESLKKVYEDYKQGKLKQQLQ